MIITIMIIMIIMIMIIMIIMIMIMMKMIMIIMIIMIMIIMIIMIMIIMIIMPSHCDCPNVVIVEEGLSVTDTDAFCPRCVCRYRDVCQKKTGKCGNFEKTGGGSTRIPLPFFTVFNMGDLPKINWKIGKKIPKQGGGGGPPFGKNSHIFPLFFLADLIGELIYLQGGVD